MVPLLKYMFTLKGSMKDDEYNKIKLLEYYIIFYVTSFFAVRIKYV